MENLKITPFQRSVYELVARIPAGQTLTYGEIARRLGKPGASRAVGQALRRNPFPGDRIPCHRVIHSSGRIEGYLGSLEPESPENRMKRERLRQEGALPSDRD